MDDERFEGLTRVFDRIVEGGERTGPPEGKEENT